MATAKRGAVRTACFIIGGFLLAGCAGVVGVKEVSSKGSGAIAWKMGKEPGNLYLSATVKESDPTSGYLLLERDIYPPFWWETRIGLFGGTAPGAVYPGSFGTELDNYGVEPFQFWGISAQPVGGGLNVWAASRLSLPGTHGTLFFPGATKVDVAIEHDGAAIRFLAKATDSDVWQQIGSDVNPGASEWPVRPAVGLGNVPSGGSVGFDNFCLESAGPPGPVDPVTEVLLDLFAAGGSVMEAMTLADGDNPDVTGARNAADAAVAPLDEAIAGVGEMVAAKGASGPPAVLKTLEKARKKLEGVRKKLAKGKAGASAVKGLAKVLTGLVAAGDTLKSGG